MLIALISSNRATTKSGSENSCSLARFCHDDDYYVSRLLFCLHTLDQQALFDITAAELGELSIDRVRRHIRRCLNAYSTFDKGVADALSISLENIGKQTNVREKPLETPPYRFISCLPDNDI